MDSPIIYIKKLNHPIKEIRERSLKLLLTKLQCGWELPDEIDRIRELLDNLLSWLNEYHLSLHKEVLQLLLITLKTKNGAYVAKEHGIRKIVTQLNNLKNSTASDLCDVFDDAIDTLRFINTVDSETSLRIPPLRLNSNSSSKSSQNGSSCNEFTFTKQDKFNLAIENEGDENIKGGTNISKTGIKCLLFPWVDLGVSDIKTMNLIMDSLKVSKSTRRCCRFIRDVFVHDFPVQIFLNRPTIIKILLAISSGQCGGNPQEALCVLLCITRALHMQFLQLFNLDFVCQSQKISENKEEVEDDINIELQKVVDYRQDTPQQDALLALRQLPVPIFALDALQTIFTIMTRSVDDNPAADNFDLKQINTCLSLVDTLVKLLLDCVSKRFWRMEHNTKTHRDIAHKTCIIMRMLGDLLTKYNKAFETYQVSTYRIVWLRLVYCGGQLLHWAKDSPLPPATLITALQKAQIDPVLDLLYPKISRDITNVLSVSKSSMGKEHKSKYSELTKLYTSIECAVKFKSVKLSSKGIEDLLICIQKTLPIFHFNLDKKYFEEVVQVLFEKAKHLNQNDKNWSLLCEIVLKLMAHSVEWIRVTFYVMLTKFIKKAFVGDEVKQIENEKCLNLLCHVEVLTEICCQGLSSKTEEVEASASEIMLLILRGRLVLSEGCWWQLLATVQPVFPLLHVYAAHDTALGKAICKSLEMEICMCMGVSRAERRKGLARALYVHCGAVRFDAARELCHLLDDKKYLPPSESLRADVMLNAMKRVEPQDFNLEDSMSPLRSSQTTGLTQIVEVLKQDLVLEADGLTYVAREGITKATLEPSLRRSTLQQLAVMMRNKDMHEVFMKNNGLNLIISLLRMSLMVDDFLTYPECAVSCVSILNSIGFENRHTLSSIQDLPLLLLRVILIFPANESCVSLCTQVLALCLWAGFLLHEIDANGRRAPAAPLSVVRRVSLPFPTLSYWNTSPNTEHSRIDWLLSDEVWRNAVVFRWWWANGGAAGVRAGLVTGASGYIALEAGGAPRSALTATASCLTAVCTKSLLELENATSHEQVIQALLLLQSFLPLACMSRAPREVCSLPWRHTARFLRAPPASPADLGLLNTLLHAIIDYMTYMPPTDNSMTWIKESFIGNEAAIIALLSKDQMCSQSPQDDIELTQLRILIVRVLVRCIELVDQDGDYSCDKMEILIKILLASLDTVDLKNFHMLGYLNELMRCLRYAMYSRYCKLSEDTLIISLRAMTRTLGGCACGSGRKGHACRLDATLATLALVTHAHKQNIPVQRWSECFCATTMRVLVADCGAVRTELRAAALHTVAALATHAQLLPHIVQCLPCESLAEFAVGAFSRRGEANVVRAAAATLLTTVTARPHSQNSENDVMKTIIETSFIEECLNILIECCNKEDYNEFIEPNVPLSVLERESELDVRAEKCDVMLSPSSLYHKPPPTASLVAALADVISNISTYKIADVKTWNEQGLYRILFRCACWTTQEPSEFCKLRAASCRALVAAATHRCVRVALANTVDCLHDFMANLILCSQIDKEIYETEVSLAQSYLLLVSLLREESGKDIVWKELRKEKSMCFFNLLLVSLENSNTEPGEAAIICLSVLTSSMTKTQKGAANEAPSVEFFDNIKSPASQRDHMSAGDGQDFEDCQPEYMAESYCKVLVKLYHEYSDSNPCYSSHDERWRRVCACLASLLRASQRARAYGAHRHLPRALTTALQRIRDALSLQGKSAEVIRNSNSDPILETLHWLLTLMICLMLDSPVVKEALCEEHVEISLVRLWPWCMMTETLRTDLLLLLVNLTNNCPKAWSRLCVCVSGRSVLGEMCTLAVRESARVRSPTLLPSIYLVLTNCTPNHHCRSVMIKSELVGSAVRSCVRSSAAAALCAALARHGDGAGAVACALPPAPPRRLLPALAHAAHHARQLCLQSQDILELFSSALLAGDTSEVVTAARAVWALAANNHRAKLILRTNGLVSAVESALQRLMKQMDGDAERAVQLLQYTYTVLQTS